MSSLAANVFGHKAGGGSSDVTNSDKVETNEIDLRTDELKWVNVNGNRPWKAVDYSPLVNRFVAVGHEAPYAGYSSDGINWQDCTGLTIQMDEIKYGSLSDLSGVFVAISTIKPYYAYSYDGITWTMGDDNMLPDLEYEGHYCGLASINRPDSGVHDTIFLLQTAENKPEDSFPGADAFVSTDGVKWQQITLDNYRKNVWCCGTFSKYQSRYIVFGDTYMQCISYDGVMWRGYSTTGLVNTDMYYWVDATSSPTDIVMISHQAENNVCKYDQVALNTTLQTLPDTPKSVTYANSWFMIPTDSDKTYYSMNGLNWRAINGLTNGTWNSCAYGNEKWVIVGETPGSYAGYLNLPFLHINRNNKNISITTKHQPTENTAFVDLGVLKTHEINTKNMSVDNIDTDYLTVNDTVHALGRVQFGGVLISANRNAYKDLPLYSWQSLTYGNGKFVAIASAASKGRSRVAYSGDGRTWYLVDNIPNLTWTQIEFGNGRFLMVGNSNICMVSIDGINWEAYPVPYSISVIGYGNGMFVGTKNSSTNSIYYTYDGTKWYEGDLPKNDYIYPGAVAFGGGIWVLGCNSTASTCGFYRSFDGIHWFGEREAPKLLVRDLKWGPINGAYGTWICSDHSHIGGHYSLDGGSTWTVANGATVTCWTSIAYGAGMFVCIFGFHHDDGYMDFYYTYDGMSWNPGWHQHYKAYWYDVCYGDGKFVIIGSYTGSDDNDAEYFTTAIITPNKLHLGRTNYLMYLRQKQPSELGTLRVNTIEGYSANIRQINEVQEINGMDIGWLYRTVMELKRATEDREALYGRYFGIDPNNWVNIDINKIYQKALVYPYTSRFMCFGNDGWTYSTDTNSWTEGTGDYPLVACVGEYRSNNYVYDMISGCNQYAYYRLTTSSTSFSLIDTENQGIEHQVVNSIACGGKDRRECLFIYVGNGFMNKSIDGKEFEIIEDMPDNYTSVCWGKNKYVVVIGGGISTLADPVQTEHGGGTGDVQTNDIIETEIPGNTDDVNTGTTINKATHGCLYSEDGIEWKEGNLPQRDWVKVIYYAYSRGLYVALSSDGYIAWSYDADNWTEFKFSNEEGWNNMTSGNGLLIVTKDDKYMYTADLTTFREGTKSFGAKINDIAFGLGKFIICTEQTNGIFVCE